MLDHCFTHYVYLRTIGFYLENGGRSRGSYIVTDKIRSGIEATSGFNPDPELCQYDRDVEKKIIEVRSRNGIISFNMEDVRNIPEQNLWFEKVWKEYLEDIMFDS